MNKRGEENIKTTMKYHYIPIRMEKMKKIGNVKLLRSYINIISSYI